MDELAAELARAVALHSQGRSAQALELAEGLLGRARGTAQAAAVFRHAATFLHALGRVSACRELAQEAGAQARATRHPEEILAASLLLLQADLYDGQVAATHRQLGDLLELAPEQPEPALLMGRLLLWVGSFDAASEQLGRALALLAADAPPGSSPARDPGRDPLRAEIYLTAARAELLRATPARAVLEAERAQALQPDSPVTQSLARALKGLALVRSGQTEAGQRSLETGLELSRAVGGWLHGHGLMLAGALARELGKVDLAEEVLRASLELVPHALERQEACCLLGELSLGHGQRPAAQAWFRQATEPSVETHFGRLAVKRLHGLLGLRPI